MHVKDLVFDPKLSDVLQKALEEAARVQGADSISASLYFSDQCHWEGTTGVTEQDPNIPVEPDMLFGFGSITKTFIAAIVLQLAEENKLGLEDTLGKWLEKYPNIDTNLTVSQLLNHSSGLGNFTDGEHFWSEAETDLDRVRLPEELLRYVGLPDSPDDIPHYSNTNYILLGMIIEAATGNSVEQELENRIIGPLHLDSTYLPKDDFDPQRWANNTALSSSLYSGVWTAGAIASTSRDIAKWSHALYSGKFLQATSLEQMLTAEIRLNGRGGRIPMGMGVKKGLVEGESAWGHGGWLGHFVSMMFYLPKFDLSVAYSSSGADVSTQSAPGSYLVRAYLDSQPGNTPPCLDPADE